MTMLPWFLAALAASFLPDAIALPRPRAPWRRPAAALAIHAMASVVTFTLTLAISARPAFAGLMAFSLAALMAIVNNAKYASLREPFVFTDLSLFGQLFRHPRLYLPFLSVVQILAIAVGAALFAGAFLASARLEAVPYGTLAAFGLGALTIAVALAARLPLTLAPGEDQLHHGFITVFVAYLLNGLRPRTARELRAALTAGPFSRTAAPAVRPDVIVIQSESFFDARRLGTAVSPAILANFDAACQVACQYGELRVPAWGANTMRTEFAMLSGVPEAELGYARFYPYTFIRRPCASLAGWFRRAAYRTSAIHPYFADFFGRDRVFPLMHFERFLDIRHFDGAQRAGPYVADAAVADAIIAELEAAGDEPAFVMAMTMENHGPLHLERVEPGEGARYHSLGDGAPWDDLTAYLRHLANADVMIGRLTDYLANRQRKAILCFYGDHVPALPKVYGSLGAMQNRSDYFIWRNYGEAESLRKTLDVSGLGRELLHTIGQPVQAGVPT
ncbi:LTA synthase family protein [Cupriavidus sp. CuC1]|uniref:LTA synthase family protein n=1 Tax=Cupriavidus sp. CuC1 TaxID=3373131 RepID=UPI0037D02158